MVRVYTKAGRTLTYENANHVTSEHTPIPLLILWTGEEGKRERIAVFPWDHVYRWETGDAPSDGAS